MQFNIHVVESLDWPFEGQPNFKANGGYYSRQEIVDPFPCYSHSKDLVEKQAALLNAAMDLDGETDIYLSKWESASRTNAHASPNTYWGEGNEDRFGATIVMSGKRTPIHPAVTRYLVAHEFGHVVEYWAEKRFNLVDLSVAYAKDLRLIKPLGGYGGRTWHGSPGELFANDYRILVARHELEYWPHEGYASPEHVPQVVNFWRAAQADWNKALAMLSSLERKSE